MGQIESSFVDNFDIDVVHHESLTLNYIAHNILIGKFKRIIVITGAGTSVSAGIPDFRSMNSGVFARLKKYNLNEPEDIFSITHFKHHPEDFMDFVKTVFPRPVAPTITHFFIQLLEYRHLLVRHYTQNIDGLSSYTTIDSDKLVELHGSFDTAHCLVCGKRFQKKDYIHNVRHGTVKHCNTNNCIGYVKPDIIFYGEHIQSNYLEKWKYDTIQCDLVIIIGTSLKVEPVSTFVNSLPLRTMRLFINMDMVEPFSNSFNYNKLENMYTPNYKNVRDVAYIGDCDEGVIEMAKLLHWENDLLNLILHWIENHPGINSSILTKKLQYLQTQCDNSPTCSIFDI